MSNMVTFFWVLVNGKRWHLNGLRWKAADELRDHLRESYHFDAVTLESQVVVRSK